MAFCSTKLILATIIASSCLPASAATDAWAAPAIPGAVSREIAFSNRGAQLRGTVYIPKNARSVPAVVALQDASIGTADAALYRHLRDGLPAMGVAVLLFDRRGSGRSTGDARSASYETLADDGIAGARAVARMPEIDPSRIGYWGLSQGGWLAALAAERDPKAAFVICVSAPLVLPEAQMEYAMSNRLQLLGYSSDDVAAMLAARRALVAYANGTDARDTVVAALRRIESKPWFSLVYLPASSQVPSESAGLSTLQHNMNFDPLSAIERLHVPVLFIFGGSDPWIPVDASVARLQRLVTTHPNIEYAVVAKASHEMMIVSRPTMATDAHSLAIFAPDAPAYFTRLASWLSRTVLGR